MNAKWFSIFALIAAATLLFSLPSCGFNQHLVSINIPESGGTFGGIGPGIFFDFTAIGTYVHPPGDQRHYRLGDLDIGQSASGSSEQYRRGLAECRVRISQYFRLFLR